MDGALINQAETHDAIDLALWAGEMMFGSGAEIDKVQRAITSLLNTCQCETISILVAHNALMVTITRRGVDPYQSTDHRGPRRGLQEGHGNIRPGQGRAEQRL